LSTLLLSFGYTDASSALNFVADEKLSYSYFGFTPFDTELWAVSTFVFRALTASSICCFPLTFARLMMALYEVSNALFA